MEIITRKAARDVGLNTYYTGKICANGHLSYRYVTSGSCAECVNGSRLKALPEPGESRAAALRRKADELEAKENAKKESYDSNMKNRSERIQMAITLKAEREKESLLKIAERDRLLAEANERKIVLDDFVEFKAPVRIGHVEQVKALLLAYAIMRCGTIKASDVWVGGTPKLEVLYRMKCHREDLESLRNQINDWYSKTCDFDAIRENIVNTKIKEFIDEVKIAAKLENSHILKN